MCSCSRGAQKLSSLCLSYVFISCVRYWKRGEDQGHFSSLSGFSVCWIFVILLLRRCRAFFENAFFFFFLLLPLMNGSVDLFQNIAWLQHVYSLCSCMLISIYITYLKDLYLHYLCNFHTCSMFTNFCCVRLSVWGQDIFFSVNPSVIWVSQSHISTWYVSLLQLRIYLYLSDILLNLVWWRKSLFVLHRLDLDVETSSSVFEGSECSSSLPRSPTDLTHHHDFDRLVVAYCFFLWRLGIDPSHTMGYQHMR